MANQPLQIVKTVSALPTTLTPNVIYLVRVGQGYDLYVTDTTGSSAYKINVSSSQLTDSIPIANNDTGATTLDNSVLLPRKIGATKKWYQSGLRHGADYPYPYVVSTLNAANGTQYFVPFTALEDATITALEIQCTIAKSPSSVSLGIYASDSNNDLSNPLFTSAPMDCSTTGAKNATCNVQIREGEVYWLSSMATGLPAFHRNTSDFLRPIKGNTVSNQAPIIGYYISGNSSMAQSAPTNKIDLSSAAPRVMFVVA